MNSLYILFILVVQAGQTYVVPDRGDNLAGHLYGSYELCKAEQEKKVRENIDNVMDGVYGFVCVKQ